MVIVKQAAPKRNQSKLKKDKKVLKVKKQDEDNDNKVMKISVSDEKRDARSLYIGKLPSGVIKQDLKDLSKDIVEVYLQKRTDGSNSRFAILLFKDKEAAQSNLNILKTKKIKGQPLTVSYGSKNDVKLEKVVASDRPKDHSGESQGRNARYLHIGDVPTDITEKELKSLSGDIVETFISKGKKKFAFLIFDSEGKAQSNYEVLKAKKIRDQPLVVKFNPSKDSITENNEDMDDSDEEEDDHDEGSDDAEDDAVNMDLKNGEDDEDESDEAVEYEENDDIDEESPKKEKVAVQKEQGRQIKASEKSKEHTKESREESDARSLYIGKLPDGVTEQDLKDLSEDIIEIYFQQRRHGGNTRFAFIRFSDEATAASNFTVLQSKTIKDQPLTVDYCGSKSTNKDAIEEDRNARELFVGSLPEDVTEADFKSLSEDIVEIFISQRPKNKYAFLTFDSKDKAESNYEILKDQKIRGQQIFVDHYRYKIGGLKQISVSRLPLDVTIEQVAGYFKKAFQITLNRSSSQRTATISFDTEQDAKEANDAAKDATISEHKLTLVLCKNTENRPERGGFGRRGQFRGGRGNFGGGRGNFGGGRGQFGGGRGQFGGGRGQFGGGRGQFGGGRNDWGKRSHDGSNFRGGRGGFAKRMRS